MNSLYHKRKYNLPIIMTIILLLLSSLLLADVNSLFPLLKPQSGFAQLSGQASVNVGNDTSSLISPLLPSDQGSLKESFEDSTNSQLITNYSFPFAEGQQDLSIPSSSSVSAMD